MRGVKTLVAASLALGVAAPGWAQSTDTRPAVTTASGDTGLWFVPTAEVLPSGTFSASVHRTEADFRQGNTNVSSFPITGAIGAGHLELFGALHVVTRIDRDTSPLLFASTTGETGGLVNDFPTVTESFTGNHLGDLYLGAKLNLMSQADRKPLAVAVRGTAKLPTADTKYGIGTGQLDGFLDVIASGLVRNVEVSAFGGGAFRGDPQDISISDGLRWGSGLAFPARGALRVTAEMFGEYLFDSAVTAPAGLLVGTDGSRSPAASMIDNDVTSSFGVTWQSRSVSSSAPRSPIGGRSPRTPRPPSAPIPAAMPSACSSDSAFTRASATTSPVRCQSRGNFLPHHRHHQYPRYHRHHR